MAHRVSAECAAAQAGTIKSLNVKRVEGDNHNHAPVTPAVLCRCTRYMHTRIPVLLLLLLLLLLFLLLPAVYMYPTNASNGSHTISLQTLNTMPAVRIVTEASL